MRATADTLQGPIQSAYREAFQSVVLPAFEKSCQSMFQQINDTFKQGTQECESFFLWLVSVSASPSSTGGH